MCHAITGAPQIIPDHSALSEIYKDVGLLIPATIPIRFDNVMTLGKMVRVEDVAASMQTLYIDKELYSKLSKAGKKKFSNKKYSWETITLQWMNLFENVLGGNGDSLIGESVS